MPVLDSFGPFPSRAVLRRGSGDWASAVLSSMVRLSRASKLGSSGHGMLRAFTAAVKQEPCLLINPLFHNPLCKLWFDSLRVDVATKRARHGALRMSFCISTVKVAAGSLKCGWFAGLVVLVMTLFSVWVAVSQTRRLTVCRSSISQHLFIWSSLIFLSFRVCCLFISCLNCRFLKARGRLRNGRASLRRKTTTCHLTRSEIQRKRKRKKKKEQDGRLDKKPSSFQNSHNYNLQFGILFFFPALLLNPTN